MVQSIAFFFGDISTLKWEISVPRELSFGSSLCPEINKVIAKCIDFMKVLLSLTTWACVFMSFVLHTSVAFFLQHCTDQQNHQEVKYFSCQHFCLFTTKIKSKLEKNAKPINNNFETQLISSVASHLVLYKRTTEKIKASESINKQARNLCFSLICFKRLNVDRKKINEPNSDRDIT